MAKAAATFTTKASFAIKMARSSRAIKRVPSTSADKEMSAVRRVTSAEYQDTTRSTYG